MTKAELALARQLVDQGASDEFNAESYMDEARGRVWELIEGKVQGEEIVAAPEEAPKAQIIDLMEALKASLGGGDEKAERKPPKRATRKPAAKKKTAVKRARGKKKSAAK